MVIDIDTVFNIESKNIQYLEEYGIECVVGRPWHLLEFVWEVWYSASQGHDDGNGQHELRYLSTLTHLADEGGNHPAEEELALT